MSTFPVKQLLLKISVLFALGFLLAACAGNSGNTGVVSNTTPAPTARGTTAPGVTPTPAIGLGAQNCPDAVKDPGHWDALIPTQANVSKVENVACGYLKGTPTLQALVTVRYQGTGSILDVYVYDKLDGATPTQIFKLLNLYKGDAKISGYNTVLTAEVDQASSANANKADAGLSQDLDREFKWSDGAGTLVQVVFPGIYPDLTRYQAEADQHEVNQGNQPWKLNATKTAQAFGAALLQWNPNAPASVVSGGGPNDVQVVVSLKNSTAAGKAIKLTMARLEGNTNGGIWIIIAVETDNMSITQPQFASQLQSPTTITGTGSAFEGVIGTVTILDHLYTALGHETVHGATGNGQTTFSTNVNYQSTFKTGAEEGLVMVTAENNAGGPPAAVVIVKVLLQ